MTFQDDPWGHIVLKALIVMCALAAIFGFVSELYTFGIIAIFMGLLFTCISMWHASEHGPKW